MASPALPFPPKVYDTTYQNEFNRVLRLYFTGQVDLAVAMQALLVGNATTVGMALCVTSVGNFDWGVVPVAGANPGAKLYLYYNAGGF